MNKKEWAEDILPTQVIKSHHKPLQSESKPILSKSEAVKQAFKDTCPYCNGTRLIHDRELGWQTCKYCMNKN